MAEYRPPLADMRFVLEHVVDLPELATLPDLEEADVETTMGILEEYGRFMTDVVAPLDRVGDTQGARLDPATGEVTTPDGFAAAYRRYVDAGWGGVPFDPDYGGGGFPWVVGVAMQEMLTAACMGFSVCPLLTQSAIEMLSHHGSEDQKERFLRPMITGDWTGTMNLTEPQAGSDVGALTTRARPADDGSGTWRISGQKIFITYGEHGWTDNIVHLVLARVPDAPPGTRGISCFIVPKRLVGDDGVPGEHNRVRCLSIEHKMGIHASPTCVLEYDEAVAELIGEPNAGMRYMFTMMNNARLSVGLQGLAIGERAYQQAVAFANERRQGRAPGAPAGESSLIVEHPDVRRMLLTARAYLEAMRCLLYFNAACIDRARHHPDSSVREANDELVELLTPVSKAWCTDLGNELCSLALQVHGGMGYIEETGIAQRYRDIRIAAIYEGTNGIQAMDLVGRKLPLRGGGVVKDFLAQVAALDGELAAAGAEFASIRASVADGVAALDEATAWLLEHGTADPVAALAGATPYLRMFGTVTGGWLLARSAVAARSLAADDPCAALAEGKVAVARFYAEQLLPAARGLLGAVTAGARDLFAIPADQL
jgi:alkylation response protein AidB-like acyl-CoA dehydrogenase